MTQWLHHTKHHTKHVQCPADSRTMKVSHAIATLALKLRPWSLKEGDTSAGNDKSKVNGRFFISDLSQTWELQ